MHSLEQYWGRKFLESEFYQPLERYVAGSSSNKIWLYTVDKVKEFTREEVAGESNVNITPTGKTIIRIVRWRARNDSENKAIKYWRTGGRNGGSYNIRSLNEWSITSEIVNQLIDTDASDTNFVLLSEEEYESLLGRRDEMDKLGFEIEKLKTLTDAKQVQLKSYKKRINLIKKNIKKYKIILSEFKSLVENEDTTETDIHRYIEKEKPFWLFGLEYVDMESHVWFPSGKKDYQFDLMLQRHDDFWDLVELKGPNENLFKKVTKQRCQPNKSISDAVSQVIKYLFICDTEKTKGILKPKATIVIGKSSRITTLKEGYFQVT